ncbi:hypothetical protein GCM10011491_08720 [Brucella endophytica]|uniref:Peptidase S1 domain-containing protein n=1 Tax=Brucella endophytica TaxID=1963359 RepID=A0A916S581_9HYPH|nr:trypsin-like serine protease [Brucella endophytica]GGA83524.1 hypothetical protein GCM10011491_08720 [Brucella endophytica]
MNIKSALSIGRKSTNFWRGAIFAISTLMNPQMAAAGIIQPTETNYVKLFFTGAKSDGTCGGSFVAWDLVLTASHCLKNDWQSVYYQFGFWFSYSDSIQRNDSTPNFIKFDQHGVPVDLALIKLNTPVYGLLGTVTARIVDQEACAYKNVPMHVFLRMRGIKDPWPQSEMDVRDVTIESIGASRLASGTALIANGRIGIEGDSGGPLMLTQQDPLRTAPIQSGVLNGSSGVTNMTYFAALCKYSNDIKRFAKQLGSSIP